ncbi:iron chaperone [Polluticoccus soli]|uniref:iron chaperone n=1 Tax=Polluticoccus soli TaxID=3034150 RepID=UPI0023E2A8FB|nr:DUF1801 domain-containing protein [Flavipsychrobacter sp. JY13-12]
METSLKFKTVDEYMRTVPEQALERAEEIRSIIKAAVPQAEEVISYNMPAYKLNSVLVYFAAYKGHIGFYPTASPMVVFKDELTKYKTSKGAIQFPLDKPIPKTLVKNIVKYRIDQDKEKAALKKAKKK